jgi:hypothetical protein
MVCDMSVVTLPTLVVIRQANTDILLGHDFLDVGDLENTRHTEAEDPSPCQDTFVHRAA